MPTITISMDILTKIITICVCLLIIAAAFFNIITLGGFSISSIILSIYYIMFAIALIVAQCKVRFFLKYFRLLAWKTGKALYCILVGCLMIQSSTFGLTMACAFVLFGLGAYYIFMHYLYKCFRKNQQQTKYVVADPRGSDGF